jgi:hypothetical protein
MADTETQLKAITPDWGQRFIEGTLRGDVEAADSLFVAMNDEIRGEACWLLLNNIPAPAYRAFLAASWEHCHLHVIAAANNAYIELGEFFEYADFPLDHLPETFRVWRGTSVLTPEQASSGCSWTTDRDTACWFAMRHAEQNGSPVVLAADIHRYEVCFSSNDRQESEILLLESPASWWIDGDTTDWVEGFTRYEGAKKWPTKSS